MGTSMSTRRPIFYILGITSRTNFNDFIFKSSSEEADDHAENGFVREQTDQRESVSLDKLTGIRLRDVNMTKILYYFLKV